MALTRRSIFKYVHISSDVACSVALESTHVGMLCESSNHLIKKYCSKKAELFNEIQLFLYSTKSQQSPQGSLYCYIKPYNNTSFQPNHKVERVSASQI